MNTEQINKATKEELTDRISLIDASPNDPMRSLERSIIETRLSTWPETEPTPGEV